MSLLIFTQIIYIVVFCFFMIMYSFLVLTPSVLLKNRNLIRFGRELGQTASNTLLTSGLGCKFYIKDQLDTIISQIHENPDLIDFVFVNHITTIDFLMVASYLQSLKISNFNFILRKGVVYNPMIGMTMFANNDIKLNRKWELDKNIITKQIDKIYTSLSKEQGKQIIVIFPEGTRITKTKLEEGQKFSKENNLPIYKNLLVPKTKGSWTVVKHLAESNKLGKIWDITLAIPSIINGRNAHIEDLFSKKIGPVYTDIRELKINDEYKDMDLFKKWVLKQWEDKDDYLSNYSNFNYNRIEYKDKHYNHIIFITYMTMLGILMLSNKYTLIYVLFFAILSYIIIGFDIASC